MSAAVNPQYPSLPAAAHRYFFGSYTGLKNLCKGVNQYASLYKLRIWQMGDAFSNVAQVTGGAKSLIAALEVFTKTAWIDVGAQLYHNKLGGAKGGTKSEAQMKFGLGLSDWGMAVHDCAMFIHATQIYAFAKHHLFRGLCFFNFCSVTFSVINLAEIKHTWDYAKANSGTLHRFGKIDRPIEDFDYKHMYISIALSVAYLALFCFSVPQLAGLAIYAQHASLFNHAQWICLATATTLTIAMGIWNELYVKPLDIECEKKAIVDRAVQDHAKKSDIPAS